MQAGKTFQILDEHGSRVIANLVVHPLIEHERKSSKGAEKHDSAIAPANYDVELNGEEEVDGRSCYVLQATPRRREKYLFEGKIWIDQQDLAITKVDGLLAKSPSFWVKRVHFVRHYQRIGEFWLPIEDTSTSDVRMFGKHTLTIRYDDYKLDSPTLAEHVEAAH